MKNPHHQMCWPRTDPIQFSLLNSSAVHWRTRYVFLQNLGDFLFFLLGKGFATLKNQEREGRGGTEKTPSPANLDTEPWRYRTVFSCAPPFPPAPAPCPLFLSCCLPLHMHTWSREAGWLHGLTTSPSVRIRRKSRERTCVSQMFPGKIFPRS
jgi:hypothetical protein